MLVWMWGVGVTLGLAALTAGIFWFIAYNTMYELEQEGAMGLVEAMWMDQSITYSIMGLLAYEWMMPWMHANMPEDKKEMMKDNMDMVSLFKLVAF